MNLYQMSHGGHGGLPLTPLHISTELQHPQHAALGPHAAHHPSLFTAAGPQPHPHAGPPQLYSGPPQQQQQVPQAGGPPSAQGAAAGANESVEQQQIRLHKHLLMLLKNGSLKTTMEGIEAQYVLSESAPQAEDGGNRIASPWVLKSHLIQVIAQLLGEPINHPMLAKTLSDFKPAIAEKESDGNRYIQLRQHREISLSVETEFRPGESGEEDPDNKKYRIVDEHARTAVALVTAFVESVCPSSRKVTSMINRNVVTYFAEPGFTEEEVQRVLQGAAGARNCNCASCSKMTCHVRFRCIINDNVLANLLEATAGAPMSFLPNTAGPQNGLGARSPLEVGMSGLSLSVPHSMPHEPAGLPYLYNSLPPMTCTGADSSTVLVSQPQTVTVSHAQVSQAAMPQTTYYSHVPSQTHGLPSQMFAGQPLLTLNAQQMGPAGAGLGQTGQSGLIGWPGQAQQGQQGPPAGLQSPEYLFQTYNVANITPGFTGSLPSASASSAHHQAGAHHASGHQHFVSVQRHASGGGGPGLGRHGAGGPQLAGGALGGGGGGGGAGGLGGPSGSKGLVSAPQKEKNLPPRLQSQNRQAAAAAAAQSNAAGYGYDGFIFNGHSNYGGRGNGRRGGGPGGFMRGRSRASYNNHFAHHNLASASLPQGGPGAPSMHPPLPPPAPTPPDLTTDFPHLPGSAGQQQQQQQQQQPPQQQQQATVAPRLAANPASAAAVVAGSSGGGGSGGSSGSSGGAVLLSNVVSPATAAAATSSGTAAASVAEAGAGGKGAASSGAGSPGQGQPLSTYADVVSMHGADSAAAN